MGDADEQLRRFKDAAREAGADMTKDEFGRVIGGLTKPQEADEGTHDGQATDEPS